MSLVPPIEKGGKTPTTKPALPEGPAPTPPGGGDSVSEGVKALAKIGEDGAKAIAAAFENWKEPTSEERERLYWLMEELIEGMAEAHKVASKCLRFGFDETYPKTGTTNRERLSEELGDIFGVMTFMTKEGDLDQDALEVARRRKLLKLQKFSRTGQ